ncbi:GNAT family N-acetyltransferase [Francisella adeliensis]|uniref:N-acetyltransferase n=1 Tax=Francisella adeliensis TaxID=2007306 RepID=A0A2Z4XY85_9GAMM|nr:N-acetyltransferase [Francisella adeliensis]AXA33452.1 GNAT family N-acetyltransferase [Francisella adeliensis]MBK2085472.1 N-acetyltransferase [Francisella adeliensis]MBK2097202.1 N-acetyltransferase [Francisella adeliensis]QIW11680.1 N-acetyltransferase [Francisella adeliensis]QIW13555.1 N-acetyltransferase [Francisella adeliensis]
MSIKIREEIYSDRDYTYGLLRECFEGDTEEKLVKLFHQDNQELISLVAEVDSEIIGQIILSKMTAEDDSSLSIYGLAPMCVSPKYQKQGVGTKLIEKAIQEAKASNIDAIFVLGHPSYYPRFGFKLTNLYQIKCEYDVPADVFMVLDISNKLVKLENQTVYYAEEFGKVF